MILLIDNFDSFVYNLARYVVDLGESATVKRHDTITVSDIERMAPSHIIISPGPCTPKEAGVSVEVVRRLGPKVPILGVCLGHQCIGAAYGASIVRAKRPMHGKSSSIDHKGIGLFEGLPNPLVAARYHSLVIDGDSLPSYLDVVATSDDGEIMAVRHTDHPVWGVQFHPESVLTVWGYHLLHRFLRPGVGVPEIVPSEADWVGS
jgi:anthranilate synthase component 2